MQSLYYVKRLEQVKSYIRDNLAGDLRIAKLSQIFQGASAALNKQFRKQYRSSLRTYIHEQKMAHALFLLQDKNITINEVADLTGYNNANNFTRAFTLYFNRSPSKARKDSGSNSSR
jgi:AraC-like DNA-binding protein